MTSMAPVILGKIICARLIIYCIRSATDGKLVDCELTDGYFVGKLLEGHSRIVLLNLLGKGSRFLDHRRPSGVEELIISVHLQPSQLVFSNQRGNPWADLIGSAINERAESFRGCWYEKVRKGSFWLRAV